MTDLNDLRLMREDYKAKVARARIEVQAELEARVAEMTEDALVELSKAVHEVHASGVTKAIINSALGVYSNAAQARPIWDAWSPNSPTDLRGKGGNDSEALKIVPDGESEFLYGDCRIWDVVLGRGDDENVVTVESFETDIDPETDPSTYKAAWKALLDYFVGVQ